MNDRNLWPSAEAEGIVRPCACVFIFYKATRAREGAGGQKSKHSTADLVGLSFILNKTTFADGFVEYGNARPEK